MFQHAQSRTLILAFVSMLFGFFSASWVGGIESDKSVDYKLTRGLYVSIPRERVLANSGDNFVPGDDVFWVRKRKFGENMFCRLTRRKLQLIETGDSIVVRVSAYESSHLIKTLWGRHKSAQFMMVHPTSAKALPLCSRSPRVSFRVR